MFCSLFLGRKGFQGICFLLLALAAVFGPDRRLFFKQIEAKGTSKLLEWGFLGVSCISTRLCSFTTYRSSRKPMKTTWKPIEKHQEQP